MGTLALYSISKSFGGIQALKGVDLELKSGEIHALVGENGAGKSTLIKIAGGVFPPDEGSILIDGNQVRFSDPKDSQLQGIVVIHQTPNLCQHLSVAENILLGHLPTRYGVVQWKKAFQMASQLVAQLGVSLPLNEPVKNLSASQQQLVALARALSLQAKWLILDEPTASLSQSEVERLFSILRQLKAQGVGILFVSHRLEEVLEISDRITVLRDGEKVATILTAEATRERLIELMVGKVTDKVARVSGSSEKLPEKSTPLLQLRNVSVEGFVKSVNLTVRRGEIVGLFGLVGAGRSELAQAIVGLKRINDGQLLWKGKEVRFRSPKDSLRAGIAYLPEDRLQQSLLQSRSIRENIGLPNLGQFSRWGVVDEGVEREEAQKQAENLKVKMANVEQPARELSGGNQQKVALSKWLLTNPELLILDEPTHGIDVATKAEIHRLILDWKRTGKTILLISSELEELQQLCDRIVVMRQGEIVGEFEPNTPQAQILEAAFKKFDRREDLAGKKPKQWASLGRIFSRELSLLLFIGLVAVAVGLKNPAFVTAEHWLTLIQEAAPMLIGAVAISIVILSGNLDLSIGSVLGACAMAAGHLAKAELPLYLVVLLALSLGAAIGIVNGTLVTRLAIPSIIVTLGMMGIVRGTMIVLTKGYWVIGLPESFRWLGTGKILGVPVPIWIAMTVLLLGWFLLSRTEWGRDLYAIGNNPEAARLAGIPVRKRLFSVFVVCGALIGLAAIVYAARFPVVQSETGKGFELDVITAAVFGGVNIFGGAGSVIGAALGAFAVTVLHSALTFMQLAGEWDKFALGGLILLSIAADSIRQRQ
ncbi:MAG: ATP-binding cassette domain-containing protein [Armatimonadota bacterium]|nr:ATP-binding cassette domain-containing protein [Armatimonadota bacterium]MDW8144218.1 ATP-binding cassette domain-containing protein [Armatimonadota bacterium]